MEKNALHWTETGILKSLVYVEEQSDRWQLFSKATQES